MIEIPSLRPESRYGIPNKSLKEFLVPTVEVERRAGLQLWDRLRGEKSDELKTKKGRMWSVR